MPVRHGKPLGVAAVAVDVHNVDIHKAVGISAVGVAMRAAAEALLYGLKPRQKLQRLGINLDGNADVEKAMGRGVAPRRALHHIATARRGAEVALYGRYRRLEVGAAVAQVAPYVEIA